MQSIKEVLHIGHGPSPGTSPQKKKMKESDSTSTESSSDYTSRDQEAQVGYINRRMQRGKEKYEFKLKEKQLRLLKKFGLHVPPELEETVSAGWRGRGKMETRQQPGMMASAEGGPSLGGGDSTGLGGGSVTPRGSQGQQGLSHQGTSQGTPQKGYPTQEHGGMSATSPVGGQQGFPQTTGQEGVGGLGQRSMPSGLGGSGAETFENPSTVPTTQSTGEMMGGGMAGSVEQPSEHVGKKSHLPQTMGSGVMQENLDKPTGGVL